MYLGHTRPTGRKVHKKASIEHSRLIEHLYVVTYQQVIYVAKKTISSFYDVDDAAEPKYI